MTTLSELRTEIAVLVKQRTNGTLDSIIDQAINDAVTFHSARALDFNEGFDTIATVSGQPSYPLPLDLERINDAQLFWGGQNFTTLIKRNWRWYLRVNQAASTLQATPSTYYAVNQQNIFLYPTPSNEQNRIELYYTLKFDPLVGDDDTNDMLQNARLLIRARAMYDIYLNTLQQNDYAANMLVFEQGELERVYRGSTGVIGQQTLEPFFF